VLEALSFSLDRDRGFHFSITTEKRRLRKENKGRKQEKKEDFSS
jgi:hypothetical protein